MGLIYKATSPSGKCYVGQTTRSLIQRKKEHWKSAKFGLDTTFSCALRKYGVDNFLWEVLEEVENSLLNEREVYFIKRFSSFGEGYNSTTGGNSGACTDAQKVKISKSLTGKKHSQATKEKMSQAHKKRHKRSPMTEETKRKIAASQIGVTWSEERRKNLHRY